MSFWSGAFWGGMVGSFIVDAVKGMFQQIAKPSGELMNKEESAISPRVADVAEQPPPPRVTSNPGKRWRDTWPPLPAKRPSTLQLDLPSKSAEEGDTLSLSSATNKLTSGIRELLEGFCSWMEHFSNSRATANDKILEFQQEQAEANTGDVSPMSPALPAHISGNPEEHAPDEKLDKKSDVGRERQHTPTAPEQVASLGPTPPASRPPTPVISQEYLDRGLHGNGPLDVTPPATPPPAKAAAPVPIGSPRPQREVANRADETATPPSPSSYVGSVPVNTPVLDTPRKTPPLSVETIPASVAPAPAPFAIANNAAPPRQPSVNEQSPAPSPQGGDNPNSPLVEGVTTPQSRPGSPRGSTAPSVVSLPVTTENLARLNGTLPGSQVAGKAGGAEDDNVSIADSGIAMSEAASSVKSGR